MAMIETLIEPIGQADKQRVIEKTEYFIRLAERHYATNFHFIEVKFDLKGRAAGMYKANKAQRVIRYNPYLFAKYFEDNLQTTVPHEVAHYVVDCLYSCSRSRPKPHGKEWREVMKSFDADASRTCDYDLAGIPVRRHQKFSYRCACMIHEISKRRHNNMQNNNVRYFCKKCKTTLSEQRANV